MLHHCPITFLQQFHHPLPPVSTLSSLLLLLTIFLLLFFLLLLLSSSFLLLIFPLSKLSFYIFFISLPLTSSMFIILLFNTSNLFESISIDSSSPLFSTFLQLHAICPKPPQTKYFLSIITLSILLSPSFSCLLSSPLPLHSSFFSYSHFLYFSLLVIYSLFFFFFFSSSLFFLPSSAFTASLVLHSTSTFLPISLFYSSSSDIYHNYSYIFYYSWSLINSCY